MKDLHSLYEIKKSENKKIESSRKIIGCNRFSIQAVNFGISVSPDINRIEAQYNEISQ